MLSCTLTRPAPYAQARRGLITVWRRAALPCRPHDLALPGGRAKSCPLRTCAVSPHLLVNSGSLAPLILALASPNSDGLPACRLQHRVMLKAIQSNPGNQASPAPASGKRCVHSRDLTSARLPVVLPKAQPALGLAGVVCPTTCIELGSRPMKSAQPCGQLPGQNSRLHRALSLECKCAHLPQAYRRRTGTCSSQQVRHAAPTDLCQRCLPLPHRCRSLLGCPPLGQPSYWLASSSCSPCASPTRPSPWPCTWGAGLTSATGQCSR